MRCRVYSLYIFKMLNQYAVDIHTSTNQSTCDFPTLSSSWWNYWTVTKGMTSRKNTWDTHGKSGDVFANPAASPSAPYPQELNPWNHFSEPLHSTPSGKHVNHTPVQDQRCQSRQSAKNSVIPSEGDSSKNFGADQQQLHISDLLHFNKFTTPTTFAYWKTRFKG